MSPAPAPHRLVPLPAMRQVYIDTLSVSYRKHIIHALLEVDVSQPRRLIAAHKARSGETLSFTAFVLGCLGQAVEANPYLHALRDWRNRLVLFDDVDVTTMIEVQAGEERFPLPHIIRAVNKRPFADLHAEIRGHQAARQRQPNPYQGLIPLYRLVPGPVRRLAWRTLFRFPQQAKEYFGTTILTSVGMFGQGAGWGIAMPLYTLGVTVGSIVQRPVLVDGQVEAHEHLCLTLSIDHDLVDGAPAARFAQHLKELLEGAHGLEA
ncbi:MAG: 2-oxo acid dehydrogenase subunit E2 [Anaerolineae bacterium]|jgi:pyruvate/2-oxoglutarate dehydrogenase complex dihydrolipoamide acyltransferase (E2) component